MSTTTGRRWGTVWTYSALLFLGISLLSFVAYLAAVYPVSRDAYIATDGGECVYVGNGTASCVPALVGGAKAVIVYNTPQSALVVNASYVGLACRPPILLADYDGSTALPVFRTELGIAICVPGPADRWTLLWRGKLDGPPTTYVPDIFSPHTQADMAGFGLFFPIIPTIVFVIMAIGACCVRYNQDCTFDNI